MEAGRKKSGRQKGKFAKSKRLVLRTIWKFLTNAAKFLVLLYRKVKLNEMLIIV
jgi:hypothetical protein